MAGSRAQNMHNFNPQTIEQKQMLINSEMLKNHFTVLNRATVRNIMLQHERIFKEQVHDLHKLYEVQKLLMQKARSNASELLVRPSQLESDVAEVTEQQRKRRNIWQNNKASTVHVNSLCEKMHVESSEDKCNKVRKKHPEENPRSPMKRRNIDLEQLPEDDTDDDMESLERLNGTAMESTVNGKGDRVSILPHKESRKVSLLVTKSREDYLIASPTSPSFELPNFSVKEVDSAPTEIMGENNIMLQNINIVSTGTKTMTLSLPQDYSVTKAPQGDAARSSLLYQNAETSFSVLAAEASVQQRRNTIVQPILSKSPVNDPQQLHQGFISNCVPNNGQSSRNTSNMINDWMKDTLGEKSLDLAAATTQPEKPFHVSESLGNTNWFPATMYAHASHFCNTPLPAGSDNKVSGGHAIPLISTKVGKGQNQDTDRHLWFPQSSVLQQCQDSGKHLWYPENSSTQLSYYQQQQIPQSVNFPPPNQATWLQSSGTMHGTFHMPQGIYGVKAMDATRLGFQTEGLHSGQVELSGSWNMLGIGHVYSANPFVPQKPPFKKPPKLILKNDGNGLELKPERDPDEKLHQGKTSSFTGSTGQDESSKLIDIKEQTLHLGESPSIPPQKRALCTDVQVTSTSSGLLEDRPSLEDRDCLFANQQSAQMALLSSDSKHDVEAKESVLDINSQVHNASPLPIKFKCHPPIHQVDTTIDQNQEHIQDAYWLEKKDGASKKIHLEVLHVKEGMNGLDLANQENNLALQKYIELDTQHNLPEKCELLQRETSSQMFKDLGSPSNACVSMCVTNGDSKCWPSAVDVQVENEPAKKIDTSDAVSGQGYTERSENNMTIAVESDLPMNVSRSGACTRSEDKQVQKMSDDAKKNLQLDRAKSETDSIGASQLGVEQASASSGKDAQAKNFSSGFVLKFDEHGLTGVETQTSAHTLRDTMSEAADTLNILEGSGLYKSGRKGSSPIPCEDTQPAEMKLNPLPPAEQETFNDMHVDSEREIADNASDSDSMAAAILLSFAPKMPLQNKPNSDKRLGVNPSECRVAGNPLHRMRGKHQKHYSPNGGTPITSVERTSSVELAQLQVKDKSIEEDEPAEMQSDNEVLDELKASKSKLLRRMEKLTDDESGTNSKTTREKTLSKIEAENPARNHMGNFKGRRSSRGLIAARMPGGNRAGSKAQQQEKADVGRRAEDVMKSRGVGRPQQHISEVERRTSKRMESDIRNRGGLPQHLPLASQVPFSQEEEEHGSSFKAATNITSQGWADSSRRTSRLRQHLHDSPKK